LVAVGANETVVPASELQEAMRRIKQLEGALGHKSLESEILKEAVDFAKAKKWIARTPDWTDGRKSPPLADDDTLKQAIAGVVKDRATYG
jgi:transposase